MATTTRKPATKTTKAPATTTKTPAKRTAKASAKPEPVVEQPADVKPYQSQLDELSKVEASIVEKNLTERRDGDDPLMAKRNALILKALDLGAGFAEIARARGVASSTNRGLIRVLQGGKRI